MTVARALLMAGAGAALTALAVSIFALREAWLDLRAVDLAGLHNGRRLVAKRALEAEISRAAALHLFVIAALGAYASSPIRPEGTPPIVVVTLSAFALGQVILAVDAARGLQARRELLDGHGHHPR